MLRVLILIGGVLIFRALLPQKTKRSTTAITPYMNGLDGMLSAQQVSLVLHETVPHQSWLARQRAKVSSQAALDGVVQSSPEDAEYSVCANQADPREIERG